MPYLGDYLGHLMTEITNARVQADLESVRLAELYASHPLLKYMPVPHFRLPTITMDVPVVIKEMQIEKKDAQTPGEVLTHMRRSFDKFLVQHLKSTGIEPSEEKMNKIQQALDKTIVSLKPLPKIPLSTTNVAEELVHSVIKVLRESGEEKEIRFEEDRLGQLAEELKHSVHVDFSRFLRSPPRLDVLITTAELREAGPSDILAHLHLSISESNVEWTTVESKGKTESRLVPE